MEPPSLNPPGPRAPVAAAAVLVLLAVPLAGCLGGAGLGVAGPEADDLGGPGPAGTGTPGVAGVRVAEIDPHWVTIHVDVAGSDDVAAWVEYGQGPEGGNRSATVRGPGSHAVALTDLRGNTTYRYRVVAQDGNRSMETPVRNVTTDPVRHDWASPETARIHPGMAIRVWRDGDWDGGCTLAFVLTTQRNASVYALTAGHCVEQGMENGEPRIAFRDGTPFATTVAYRYDGGFEGADWALVRIGEDRVSDVSPAVVNWTGPTGTVPPTALEPGRPDELCFGTENGEGRMSNHRPKRDAVRRAVSGEEQRRCGTFEGYDRAQQALEWDSDVIGGDSGSPVIDPETGKAAGLLVGTEYPHVFPVAAQRCTLCTAEAYPVALVMDELADQGWDLAIARSTFDPPSR